MHMQYGTSTEKFGTLGQDSIGMASYTKNLLSVSWSKTQIGHRTEKVVSMSLKSAHTSAGPRQSKASPAPFFSSLQQLGHNRRHNPHHEAHQPNHRDFQAQHRLISPCQYPTIAALQVRSLTDVTQHARLPRVSYTSLSLIQACSNSKYSTCISGLGLYGQTARIVPFASIHGNEKPPLLYPAYLTTFE